MLSLQCPLADIIHIQLRLSWFQPYHSGRDNWYYDVSHLHDSERAEPALRLNLSDSVVDRLIGYKVDTVRRDKLLRTHTSHVNNSVRRQNIINKCYNIILSQ